MNKNWDLKFLSPPILENISDKFVFHTASIQSAFESGSLPKSYPVLCSTGLGN